MLLTVRAYPPLHDRHHASPDMELKAKDLYRESRDWGHGLLATPHDRCLPHLEIIVGSRDDAEMVLLGFIELANIDVCHKVTHKAVETEFPFALRADTLDRTL